FIDDKELIAKYKADEAEALRSNRGLYIEEEQCINQAGDAEWFETRKIPLKNGLGRPDRVLFIANRLTEQKRYEKSLREREAFLRSILDVNLNWILVKDREGKVVLANDSIASVFGVEPADLVGRTDADFNPHEEEVESFTEADRFVFETGETLTISEEKTTGADGQEYWTRTVKSPLYNHAGEIDHILVTAVPINEIKSTTEALRESESFMRQVIDTNPNLIVVKDLQGKFLLANQACCDLFGLSHSQILGKTDQDVNPNKEEVDRFREMDQHVFDSGEALTIPEEKITDHHGNVCWLQTTKIPLFNSDGEVNRIFMVAVDITQRKEFEEAMESATRAAEEASQAKTSFLTRMSHELRTPLNAILGFSQLLGQDQSLSDEQAESISVINTSGQHLLNLISSVLDMTKIENGQMELSENVF
ncbi:MAG: PAS domain-containing protein, partial [Verrucomicrobiota bacterium]